MLSINNQNQSAMATESRKEVKIESLFVYETRRGAYYKASSTDNFNKKTKTSKEDFEKIRSLGDLFIYRGQIAYGW